MSNLASSLHAMGRNQEALEVREKVQGSVSTSCIEIAASMESPSTFWTLLMQVVKLHTRILGDRHPETLQSILALALSFLDMGRNQEALELIVVYACQLLVNCLKQDTPLDTKTAAHALQSFT